MKLRKTPPTKYAPSMDARYAVPALDKGLDVIELLARETDGLTLNEIARLLGRTSSELFRMVKCALPPGLYRSAGRPLFVDVETFRARASPQADQVAHRRGRAVDAR